MSSSSSSSSLEAAREALHFPELPTPDNNNPQRKQQQQLIGLMPLKQSRLAGHQRSASHGGTSTPTPPPLMTNANHPPAIPSGRPSALKRHQRAFSQGQLGYVPARSGGGSGSRVGSRTEFTLPVGHRDGWPPPAPGSASSLFTANTSAGHKRQASRSESIYTVRGGLAIGSLGGSGALSRALQLLLRRKAPAIDTKLRAIVPNHMITTPNANPSTSANHHNPNIKWPSNGIRTTKYTILSFIPKNLFEQFHRVANLYFIAIVLLNWIPAINAFGKEISMIPVLFVLGVTAIKDLFEDRRRYISDQRINNSYCRVYDGVERRYRETLWKQIRVGDIVQITNNELIPADVLLLHSSDNTGLCYLDTCNLDGETNLKQRVVPPGIGPDFNPSTFDCVIEVEAPSTRMYRFSGALIKSAGDRIPVGTDHLLLRESLLKNTDYVEGVVVYAGHETKALLNNGGPRYKRTAVERQMNRDIIWCVVILLVLCLVGGIGCRMWLSSYEQILPTNMISSESFTSNSSSSVPFILVDREPGYEGFLTFLTFVIILQVMIPLSLYVTVEVCKLLQVYHMHQDPLLSDPNSGYSVECRALNTTEELGQVQHIFSDKTGTLTENRMIFRRITAGNTDYNHPDKGNNSNIIIPNDQLSSDIKSTINSKQLTNLQELLLVLALCNTVVVSNKENSTENRQPVFESDRKTLDVDRYQRLCESRSATPSPTPLFNVSRQEAAESSSQQKQFLRVPGLLQTIRRRSVLQTASKTTSDRPQFEAESPDELALVQAAFAYGCRLTHRSPDKAVVTTTDGSVKEFAIVQLLPFDAIRKCMSIVIRAKSEVGEKERLVLYSKGADTSILSNVAASEDEELEERLSRVQQQVQQYARQGLRVLLFARRFLGENEFALWQAKHREVELQSQSHNMTGREQRLSDSYARLETHLTLLGATGVEDRLQPGVPDCLSRLATAGICVWVLTGDKPETAINVAYSARLFTHKMDILQLHAFTKTATENAIKGLLSEIHASAASPSSSPTQASSLPLDHNAVAAAAANSAYQVDLDGRGVFGGGAARFVLKKPPVSSFSTSMMRGLVVDGRTLTFILDPRSGLLQPFIQLTNECSSVLCCRATPLQKSLIVRMVKEVLHKRTLAIGDGANDVSMIQTADVGVAVRGAEGRQAVLAADYAIPRFAALAPLLLVHGHWCYDRLARMVLYFFYKNATFVFLIFWYQLYCGYSASVMIDQMHLMLYNLMFTSLPPIAIGVYDEDCPPALLLQQPALYKQGSNALVYQPVSFWLVMADAVYQSIVIFFITLGAYDNSEVSVYEFGVAITSSCVFIMLTQVAMDAKSWTLVHVIAILGSIVVYFSFTFLYNGVCDECLGLPSNYWVIQRAAATSTFWLLIFLLLVTALLPRWLWICHQRWLKPNDLFRAVRQYNEHARKGNRELLTNSWSTLTSSTSITRSADLSTKTTSPPALACVG